jgi:hypothetical protein
MDLSGSGFDLIWGTDRFRGGGPRGAHDSLTQDGRYLAHDSSPWSPKETPESLRGLIQFSRHGLLAGRDLVVLTRGRYSCFGMQTSSDNEKSWKQRKIFNSEWLFVPQNQSSHFLPSRDRPWSKFLVPADSGISGNAANYDITINVPSNCNISIDRDFE